MEREILYRQFRDLMRSSLEWGRIAEKAHSPSEREEGYRLAKQKKDEALELAALIW